MTATVIGAIVVLLGAIVARNATRYAAELEAAQRRRDSQLVELKEFSDSVTALIAATAKYVFVLHDMDLPTDADYAHVVSGLPEPQRQKRMSLLLDIVDKRERSRALSSGIPWENIREQYMIIDTFAILFRDHKIVEALAWSNEHTDITMTLVALIGERRRELLASPKPRRWSMFL